MRTLGRYLIPAAILSLVLVCVCVSCRKHVAVHQYTSVPQSVRISPDYTDTVIPPNIAPLNFRILETGKRFFVKISASKGISIEIHSRSGDIQIPPKSWKQLLNDNKGEKIVFDVYVFESTKGWLRYPSISNKIAGEAIDSYLVYRFIHPIFTRWKSVGIYQRNLENYNNTLILHGRLFNKACINCHTFCNNSPETMTIGVRSENFGNSLLMACGGTVDKVNATWGYTSWHPSGKLTAYSMNKVRQFFHTSGIEIRDVVDLDSAIVYYALESKTVKTIPALSQKDRLETYPCWSPDGKFLYYCSAPILWEDRNALPPKNYDQVKYDLMRISYDMQTDQWGEPEVVLAAKETGLSIGLPRVSPDGRFLVFSMCDYGCFPVFRPSSDLYLMNLQTREYRKLDTVNSPYSESWHSFSSNGRWLAFSSKRIGGIFTRTYLAYIDGDGKAYKPFILPQQDPQYYDSLLHTYSVPELITHAVDITPGHFARTAMSKEKINISLPVTSATPVANPEPWQQGGK